MELVPQSWHLLTFSDKRYETAKARLVECARTYGATQIHAFTPEALRRFSWNATQAHLLRAPKGRGYWLWKPFLTFETLLTMRDGEYLLYCDAGAALISSPSPLFELAARTGGLLFFEIGNGYRNAHYVKRDCFILLGCDCERFWEAQQVNGAFFVLQKNARTLQLVAEWVAWSDSLELITDAPNRCGMPDRPGFIAHRYDQAILSLLVAKHGFARYPDPSQHGESVRSDPHRNPDKLPTIFDHHRKRNLLWHELIRRKLGAIRHRLLREPHLTSAALAETPPTIGGSAPRKVKE